MPLKTAAEPDKAGWCLDNSYARLPPPLFSRARPTPVQSPAVLLFNQPLAQQLGLDLELYDESSRAQLLAGNRLPAGADPIAQAYAGHQFGNFTMLGDGRALLLGEQVAPDGGRYDIQLKGSGPTAFSRRGDGRAALAPMLREHLISEAMHALGIPTARSLGVVTTGEYVYRDRALPGAILTRVAASHIRIGTFEFAAAYEDGTLLQRLADYTIDRHYPHIVEDEQPYRAFLQAVIKRQAQLVAAWMQVGFVHGVMNTDNIAISGETIDYGPCAFIDAYDPATVFSSIDHQGRYAYGNQPAIMQWNLARLAEALLPLLASDSKRSIAIAEQAVEGFSEQFESYWLSGMRAKLGLHDKKTGDLELVNDLLYWMHRAGADFNLTFRDLSAPDLPQRPQYQAPDFCDWRSRWQMRQQHDSQSPEDACRQMRQSNPAVIPRNHQVEAALRSASEHGEYRDFYHLLAALQQPYETLDEYAEYQQPPPPGLGAYRTFCGT